MTTVALAVIEAETPGNLRFLASAAGAKHMQKTISMRIFRVYDFIAILAVAGPLRTPWVQHQATAIHEIIKTFF